MKILVAEDDFVSKHLLVDILSEHGDCETVEDGEEALASFKKAYEDEEPYDMVCLDIMMPKMDGRDALRNMRSYEDSKEIAGSDKVKIIMTTALDDTKSIMGAFSDQCEAYVIKPILKEKLVGIMEDLGLIEIKV